MDRTTDPNTTDPAALAERLVEGAGRPAAEIAAEVEAALARAEAGAPGAAVLDAAALRAIGECLAVDEVLRAIGIERLAALLERLTAHVAAAPGDASARDALHDLLDLVRRPVVATRIARDEHEAWAGRLLAAVERSHYTVGRMFRRRAEAYGSKVLFQIPQAVGTRVLSWRRAATRVELYSRGLLALDSEREPGPVAILSENRIEMALVDLACMTSGIVNVMIPGNATEADVGFMLRHSRARTVVVSSAEQLRKVAAHRDALNELRHVVMFDVVPRDAGAVTTLDALLSAADRVPIAAVVERAERVRIDDLATVMYTSGTTGTPKGIRFSQRNLVFKRFARGLALPQIGEDDVFLCFLPLFHTFGRFFEMLGCVFWGATYSFLESTSVEALVSGMRRHRPTVFISVPKKWMQLHEAIAQRADPIAASDEELERATREVTGGRLRWGLSAAGHLDSDVFRFFQRQGVELISGFGMTEATGGITMTPPGEYRDDSLGLPLPGIETKLAADGELCVRGPYVMIGYLDPPDGESSFDDDGWLHSGDLMERDADGHLRLVDRKKEIYKNIKGETIAPQRIENMFRDFDAIGRVFLVGDHREFNTLLVYPNPNYEELNFAAMSPQEIKDHFRSLLVSVNRFLAPYERIVDFAVIERDLDAELGELTAKGTPRRSQIARNFAEQIRLLYRRTNLQVGGTELTLPNWLLQTVGITAQDIRIGDESILMPRTGTSLTVRRVSDELTRIGACLYHHPHAPLNLGALLTSPRLWLGNEELVAFVDLEPTQRQRPGRNEEGIEWRGRSGPFRPDDAAYRALSAAARHDTPTLADVHSAACMLAAAEPRAALVAVDFLRGVVSGSDDALRESARLVLFRGAESEEPEVARRAFQALVPAEKDARFRTTLERFLAKHPTVLDGEARAELCRLNLPPAKVQAFVLLTQEACTADRPEAELRAIPLLRFLAAYGAAHPTSYRSLRGFLVRMGLFARGAELRQQAHEAAETLQKGFRAWLGPSARIAVDPETGQEYHWDDVVVFDDDVVEEDRARLMSAIKNTAILREASFLFSKGVLIRLNDIPPGGIWIRLLGARHGKAVYRIAIQTRFQGGYDLAVNVNQSLTAQQVSEELQWLILAGEADAGHDPLVEDFGGYWPKQDLWSEEFISGETLDRAMRRLARQSGDTERFRQLWPFLAWTALSAYVDFWHRCGDRSEIADAGMSNVIVPIEDYHTGVRIVSVSARRPHRGLLSMVRSFMEGFVAPAVEKYPELEGIVGWDVVFSSVLEVVGEDRGMTLLRDALAEAGADDFMHDALRHYMESVRVRGFLPRRLFFAAKRYRRWERLSTDATTQARARTLQELWETYGLQRLAPDYPEARVRFFRETVFRDGPPALIAGLEELISVIRSGQLAGDELYDAVAELRARLELSHDDDYFLARISLPYLRPEDAADFVRADRGGRQQSEIVVNLEDHEGNPFRVRHALNPKEVGKLHRLFLAAKLDVRFRPEHRYLVAINDRQQIIAGIYYEIEEDGENAHLEKIVVADPYRKKGVADGLMKELFNRLRAAGVDTLTTGFFRPEYFYAYGFRIEKRYAGLVKALVEPPAN